MKALHLIPLIAITACWSEARVTVAPDVAAAVDQRFQEALAARAERPPLFAESPVLAPEAYDEARTLVEGVAEDELRWALQRDRVSPALAAVVADHGKQVAALLVRGASSPRVRASGSILPDIFRRSTTARVAVLVARDQVRDGDSTGAVTTLLATTTMGLDTARTGTIMTAAVGEAIAELGIAELTRLVHEDALSPKATLALQRGLARLMAMDYDPVDPIALELRYLPWLLAHADTGPLSLSDMRDFLGDITRGALGDGDFAAMAGAFVDVEVEATAPTDERNTVKAALAASRTSADAFGEALHHRANAGIARWSGRREATRALYIALSRDLAAAGRLELDSALAAL